VRRVLQKRHANIGLRRGDKIASKVGENFTRVDRVR
jgi:hypothetical protein